MTGFAVDHEQLANAGQQITAQGGSSSSIAQQVQAAEVPTLAWGMLGVSTGLYGIYVGMLADLNQHLADMGQHLNQTGSTMVSNARAYQQIDQAIAATLRQLDPGTASA